MTIKRKHAFVALTCIACGLVAAAGCDGGSDAAKSANASSASNASSESWEPGSASLGDVKSTVLSDELNRVVEEFIAQAATQPRDPRQKAADPARMVETLGKEVPDMLLVTQADEKRLQSGQFDDTANRARVDAANKVARLDRGPQLVRHLAALDQAKPFTGVRLELFAHLAERHAKLMQWMKEQQKKQGKK